MNHTDHSYHPGTFFAPAGRSDSRQLQRQVATCLQHPMVNLVLELVDSCVLVLNENRQVLVANSELTAALSAEDSRCYQGLRPGEILGCTHVPEGPDGCGTSQACARCGAVLALLAAQSLGEPVSRECQLNRYVSGAWRPCDYRVKATPFSLESQRFTVAVLQDIGPEKRARLMEGLFLHDLGNTVQGLHGWSEMLLEAGQDPRKAADQIRLLAESLGDEVLQHQMLMRAETRELVALPERVKVQQVMEKLERTLRRHPSLHEHLLELLPVSGEEVVDADPLVLHRVLLNMTINALEAAPPDSSIQFWFKRLDGRPCFFVRNPGVIPEMIRPHIFQRSFSTKGRRGRGIGTYSMKFLGENILEGEVGFATSMEEGTIFHLYLPVNKQITQSL